MLFYVLEKGKKCCYGYYLHGPTSEYQATFHYGPLSFSLLLLLLLLSFRMAVVVSKINPRRINSDPRPSLVPVYRKKQNIETVLCVTCKVSPTWHPINVDARSSSWSLPPPHQTIIQELFMAEGWPVKGRETLAAVCRFTHCRSPYP